MWYTPSTCYGATTAVWSAASDVYKGTDSVQTDVDMGAFDVGQAIHALNKQAAAGLDRITAAQLALLDLDNVQMIASAFAARMAGRPGHVGRIHTWRQTILWGVPKGKCTGGKITDWMGDLHRIGFHEAI